MPVEGFLTHVSSCIASVNDFSCMFPEIFCTTLKFQRFKNLFWEKVWVREKYAKSVANQLVLAAFLSKEVHKNRGITLKKCHKRQKINCFPKNTINNVEISTFNNKCRETLAPTRSIGDAGKPIPVPKNRIP